AAPPSGVGSTPTTCAEGEGAGGAGEGDAGGIPRRSGTPVRYRTWPCLVLPARRPTTGGPGHAATWPRSVTRCPTGRRRRTPRGASAVSAPGPALSALPATHSDLPGTRSRAPSTPPTRPGSRTARAPSPGRSRSSDERTAYVPSPPPEDSPLQDQG